MKSTNHPILDRVAIIDPRFIEPTDLLAPTNSQEFLDWWWENKARECTLCTLADRRTTVVTPDGVASAQIMIVGEGPGFMEDLTALPMVGPLELRNSRCNECTNAMSCFKKRVLVSPTARTGKTELVTCTPNFVPGKNFFPKRFFVRSAGAIVDGILMKKWRYSYPRHNWITLHNRLNPTDQWVHTSPWYITNTVLCRSTDKTGLKDQPPESVPRQKCKMHLAYQWAAVEPKVIVAFGRIAMTVLCGSETRAKQAKPLDVVDTKFGPVIFQNHPAYFMREESKEVKAYGFAKVAETLARALDYAKLPR